MRPVDCEFEAETLTAALQSCWPERVSAELRAHVAACTVCSDVITIAAAINNANEETRSSAAIPDAGLVWWRAQLRARREAAEAAGRPITAAQVVALACVTGLLGACFGATSSWFQSILNGIVSTVTLLKLKALLLSTLAFVDGHAALIVFIAALVLLLPTAVYLAIIRD